MLKIVPIVEGAGEVNAVPILVHRILKNLGHVNIQVSLPKDAHGKGNLIKADGVEKFVRHAWKERDCGAILILLDADRDCPKRLASEITARVEKLGARFPVVTVCAKGMYETWFLAGIEGIVGENLEDRPGLAADLKAPDNVENLANAKAWLSNHFTRGRAYKETEDQAALTRLFDLEKAHERSRSFRRLCRAVAEAVEAINSRQIIVTPKAK